MRFSSCCARGQDRAATAAAWHGHPSLSHLLNGVLLGAGTAQTTVVKAQSSGTPQVDVRPVDGQGSLIVYYPDLKKIFVLLEPVHRYAEVGLRLFD